ncbi:MAG: hypothetical protein LIO57_00330 [Oscillospiraceae bacterium]|nr:hypothetical protein [Oscillospiraceae bacterium]
MACFIIPAAEAVVTTIIAHELKKKESRAEVQTAECDNAIIPASKKLGWLNRLLWGGSALLCFEHIWHGEVVPWFPFLTAAGDSASAAVMVSEMLTVGVGMAALITAVWCLMLAVIKAKTANTASERGE